MIVRFIIVDQVVGILLFLVFAVLGYYCLAALVEVLFCFAPFRVASQSALR